MGCSADWEKQKCNKAWNRMIIHQSTPGSSYLTPGLFQTALSVPGSFSLKMKIWGGDTNRTAPHKSPQTPPTPQICDVFGTQVRHRNPIPSVRHLWCSSLWEIDPICLSAEDASKSFYSKKRKTPIPQIPLHPAGPASGFRSLPAYLVGDRNAQGQIGGMTTVPKTGSPCWDPNQ